MGSDLAALLQNYHRDVLAGLGRELLEPDRRGKPCGPGADDHHVELHGLAFGHVVQRACSSLRLGQGFYVIPAKAGIQYSLRW